MQFWVNQELKQTAHNPLNLLVLIQDLGLENKGGLAIAINQTVIPKSTWTSTQINENDHITIIRATQGG